MVKFGFWTPIFSRFEMYFGFQSPGFRIPQANFSGFPYMANLIFLVVTTINKRVRLTGNNCTARSHHFCSNFKSESQNRHQFPAVQNLSRVARWPWSHCNIKLNIPKATLRYKSLTICNLDYRRFLSPCRLRALSTSFQFTVAANKHLVFTWQLNLKFLALQVLDHRVARKTTENGCLVFRNSALNYSLISSKYIDTQSKTK